MSFYKGPAVHQVAAAASAPPRPDGRLRARGSEVLKVGRGVVGRDGVVRLSSRDEVVRVWLQRGNWTELHVCLYG